MGWNRNSRNKLRIHIMTDITYILITLGFFALMLLFVWVCEKV